MLPKVEETSSTQKPGRPPWNQSPSIRKTLPWNSGPSGPESKHAQLSAPPLNQETKLFEVRRWRRTPCSNSILWLIVWGSVIFLLHDVHSGRQEVQPPKVNAEASIHFSNTLRTKFKNPQSCNQAEYSALSEACSKATQLRRPRHGSFPPFTFTTV